MTKQRLTDASLRLFQTKKDFIDAKVWIIRPGTKNEKRKKRKDRWLHCYVKADTIVLYFCVVGLQPSWTAMTPSLASRYRADGPLIHLPMVNHEKKFCRTCL